MSTKLEWKEVTEEEFEEYLGKYNDSRIIGRLIVSPELTDEQIEKIWKIEGAGWVDEESDCAAICAITPTEIIVWSGCCPWCEHTKSLISQILAKIADAEYIGPSLE